LEVAPLVLYGWHPQEEASEGGQKIYLGGFRAAVVYGDSNQNVFRITLGMFDEDVEVTIIIEYAGIEEFVPELFPWAPPLVSTKSR
jgi:hypothetical protein